MAPVARAFFEHVRIDADAVRVWGRAAAGRIEAPAEGVLRVRFVPDSCTNGRGAPHGVAGHARAPASVPG